MIPNRNDSSSCAQTKTRCATPDILNKVCSSSPSQWLWRQTLRWILTKPICIEYFTPGWVSEWRLSTIPFPNPMAWILLGLLCKMLQIPQTFIIVPTTHLAPTWLDRNTLVSAAVQLWVRKSHRPLSAGFAHPSKVTVGSHGSGILDNACRRTNTSTSLASSGSPHRDLLKKLCG